MSTTNKPKILITGGNGFIGRHLARRFINQLYDVTICDVAPLPSYKKQLCETAISDVQVYLESLDLAERMPNIYPSPDQFDVIFHLAAIPRVTNALERPELSIGNNINSTLRVLQYCRQHPGTKLIFTSSGSVRWADLDNNPYALSKHICEELIRTYTSTFGVEAAIVRLFNVYGPGEADYGSATTLLKACKKALTYDIPITVYGDGSQVRAYTHVDDTVRGLAFVMSEMLNGDWNALYELGTDGESVATIDIVRAFTDDESMIRFKTARSTDGPKSDANRNLWPDQWSPIINVLDYIEQWKIDGCPND
jgi:UDP-glucose 4-epimerase